MSGRSSRSTLMFTNSSFITAAIADFRSFHAPSRGTSGRRRNRPTAGSVCGGLRVSQCVRRPGPPVHRIVLMLKQVRAGFAGEPVGVLLAGRCGGDIGFPLWVKQGLFRIARCWRERPSRYDLRAVIGAAACGDCRDPHFGSARERCAGANDRASSPNRVLRRWRKFVIHSPVR